MHHCSTHGLLQCSTHVSELACGWLAARSVRGGKGNDYSGGTRVAAWVNGGLLPNTVRGGTITALIHMADWYATVCGLANVDPRDSSALDAGLPPIDSLDQWPILSRPADSKLVVRKELVTGFTCRTAPCTTVGAEGQPLNAALLDSDGYKLIVGTWISRFCGHQHSVTPVSKMAEHRAGNGVADGPAPGLWCVLRLYCL